MKRVLLILAGVIGLIVAGGAVASIPLGSPSNQGALNSIAPSRRARQAPWLTSRPAGSAAHPQQVHQAASRLSQRQSIPPAPPKMPMPQVSLHPWTSMLLPAAPSRYLLVNPTGVAPGATVAVRGGGFAPGTVLHLSVQAPGRAPVPQVEVTTEADGSFRATVTTPATQTAPLTELVAQDAQGSSAAATVLVRIGQPVAGIAPDVVAPGQRVALSIAGFRAGETLHVYAERLEGRPILTASVGADSGGSLPLTVPYGPGGLNQMIVIGDQGRIPVVAQYLLLNLYPRASVSNYAPQPGARVTFSGAGFGPNEPVELRLDRPDALVLAVARAGARGSLQGLGPYRVPFGATGYHTFIVRGADSHASTTVGVTVQPFYANVQPSTYAAGPGTMITFYGAGFAPNEIVRVYVGRTATRAGTEVASLQTTATGRLIASSGSYALPPVVHGSALAFALVGDISGAEAWTSVHYLAPGPGSLVGTGGGGYRAPAHQHPPFAMRSGARSPLLVATPPRVVAGGRVSLWGAGFPPRSRVHLVLESRDNPQGWALRTARSTANGTLNTAVTVPAWVAHADVVRADAGAGGASAVARAELAVWPALPGLKPWTYAGTAGTVYGLSGYGFAPGERISLYLDSVATPPLATTFSSRIGEVFFAGVPMPLVAAGDHTVIISGTSGDIAVVPFTEIPLTPFLLLSTYSSLPEQPIGINGQGFAPEETVHFWVGPSGRTFVGGAITDLRGALRAPNVFTIAGTARGRYPIVAVGAASGRAVRATLNVRPYQPALWPSSWAGHPGSTVVFGGNGYARHDIVRVYVGDSASPAATIRAYDGAFNQAGAVRVPFGTQAGPLFFTVRGAISGSKVILRYLVIAFMPGAGFQIRHQHGITVLRLGGGGFAPNEIVQVYQGTGPNGTPLHLLRANVAGYVPLVQVLAVRGTPRVSLAYTLVGVQSGARATALYPPPRPGRDHPSG